MNRSGLAESISHASRCRFWGGKPGRHDWLRQRYARARQSAKDGCFRLRATCALGHARIRGSRGWVTARGHPASRIAIEEEAGDPATSFGIIHQDDRLSRCRFWGGKPGRHDWLRQPTPGRANLHGCFRLRATCALPSWHGSKSPRFDANRIRFDDVTAAMSGHYPVIGWPAVWFGRPLPSRSCAASRRVPARTLSASPPYIAVFP